MNNLPGRKRCTYSCVYCQVGAAGRRVLRRRSFDGPERIAAAVALRLRRCRAAGARVDYVTFVPNGEPTLDARLGAAIRAVKAFGVPVAVITNGSLLWRPEVRAALAAADLVSVKVDAVSASAWRRVNRPSEKLDLPSVLEGVAAFASAFSGELMCETMLVAELNDDAATVEGIAAFLKRVRPRRTWLAVPTRPPAVAGVRPPDAAVLARAYAIVSAAVPHVELLAEAERGAFDHGGDPADDLLGILAVHPMSERAVREFLSQARAGWEVAEGLLASGAVTGLEHGGERYLRRASHRPGGR